MDKKIGVVIQVNDGQIIAAILKALGARFSRAVEMTVSYRPTAIPSVSRWRAACAFENDEPFIHSNYHKSARAALVGLMGKAEAYINHEATCGSCGQKIDHLQLGDLSPEEDAIQKEGG